MEKSKQETYQDVEEKFGKFRGLDEMVSFSDGFTLCLNSIKALRQEFPNDAEFGAAVINFINGQE